MYSNHQALKRPLRVNQWVALGGALTLFAFLLATRTASARPSLQSISTGIRAQVVPTVNPAGEDLADVRLQDTGRRGDVTAIRLDESGNPVARFDLHFGRVLPANVDQLFGLLNRFDVGESHSFRESAKQREDLRWRTVLLPSALAPEGAPDIKLFDPQADFVVEVRSISNPTAISCFAPFKFKYFGDYAQEDYTAHVEVQADMVAATAGGLSVYPGDPDLQLKVRNSDGIWVLHNASSDYGPDTVAGHNGHCWSLTWRAVFTMSLEGSWFIHVTKFTAH